jgi:hypothetical protein
MEGKGLSQYLYAVGFGGIMGMATSQWFLGIHIYLETELFKLSIICVLHIQENKEGDYE